MSINDMRASDWAAIASGWAFLALIVWVLVTIANCNTDGYRECAKACGSVANVDDGGDRHCKCRVKP